MTLNASAVAAALDGCLNETLAALEASKAAASAKPEAIRLVLEEIAADEQAHAELAWEYVAWALGIGGPALREELSRAVDIALQRLEVEREPAAGVDSSAWGLLDHRARHQLRAHCLREVLRPAFERLLRASG